MGPAADNRHPNVILIMCDQWRADCLGCLGHPLVKTPHIDALAAEGAIFENAYCSSPVCSPARGSWLTGLYPHAHGQLVNYGRKAGVHACELNRDCVTLGDAFKGAGYRCGIVGPWHLGHDHEPQHGFEDDWQTYNYQGEERPDRLLDYFESEGLRNLYDKRLKKGHGKLASSLDKMKYFVLEDPRQQRTTWTVDRGLEFIDACNADGDPFFLFLSVKDPHATMVVHQDDLDLYPPEEIPLPDTWGDPLKGKPGYQHTVRERIPAETSASDMQRLAAHYFALMTHIDREVGRVVGHLERAGLCDNTVIAFISDHGEMLGDHGFVAKRLFYEGSVKVPIVIAAPGRIPGGQRVTVPVGGVDLLPTLLECAGVAVPSPVDGHSLAPALRDGRQPEARPVFAELATEEVHNGMTDDPAGRGGHVMVRDGEWKYVWNRLDRDELYNLNRDPGEMENLADGEGHRDVVAELREKIRGMLPMTGPGVYEWCLHND